MNIGKILSLTVLLLLIINLISNNFKLDLILFCKILATFLIFLYSSNAENPPNGPPPTPPVPRAPSIDPTDPAGAHPPLLASSPSIKREKSLSEKYQISDLPIKKLNFDTIENSPKEPNSPLIIMEEPSPIQADLIINIPQSRKPIEKRAKPLSAQSDSKTILKNLQKDRDKNTQIHKNRLENLKREYEEMIQSSRLKLEIESLIKPASPIRVQTLQLPVILETRESEVSNDFTPKVNKQQTDFKISALSKDESSFNPRPLGSKPMEQSALEMQLKSLGDGGKDDKNQIPPHMLLPVYKVKPYATQDPILRTPTSIDQPAFRPNPLSQSNFVPENSKQMTLNGSQENFVNGSSGFFANVQTGNSFRNNSFTAPVMNPFAAVNVTGQTGNTQSNPFAAVDHRNVMNLNTFSVENNKYAGSASLGAQSGSGNVVAGFNKPGSQFFENKETGFLDSSNRVNPFSGFNQFSESSGFKSAISRPSNLGPDPMTSNNSGAMGGFNISNPINPFSASSVQGYSTPVNPFSKNNVLDGTKSKISDFSQVSMHSSYSSSGPSTFQHNPTPTPTTTSVPRSNPSDFLNLPLSTITLDTYKQIRSQIPFQDRAIKEAAEQLLLLITDLYPSMSEYDFKCQVEKITSIFSNFPSSKLSILSVNFTYLVLDTLLDYHEDSQVTIKFSEYFAKIFIHLDRFYKSLTTLLIYEVQSQFSIFTGVQLNQKEVHESWQLEDLKKRKQGGELQKSIYVEMRNVEVLTIFYMVVMVEMGQMEKIREFLTQLQSPSREVLPLMVGVLICLSRNPRLLIANQLQMVINEHGKRFDELNKICNMLFFSHEIMKFKDLYNKLYGFS